MTKNKEKRTERFNFRISAEENDLIKAAARLRRISASQYVAKSAAQQAEMDLADRRYFTLSTRQMEDFQKALDEPAKEKPRLRQLFTEKTVLYAEEK